MAESGDQIHSALKEALQTIRVEHYSEEHESELFLPQSLELLAVTLLSTNYI